MVKTLEFEGRRIGPGFPAFIIAEAGVNHNGDLNLAHQLIDRAAQAGVDAVKFQTFTAQKLVTALAPKAEYQLQNTGSDESQFEMLRRLELSPEAHADLWEYCREKGLLFMSTPFDEESVDFLDQLGMKIVKVASGELTNVPLLIRIAKKGRPMIVSTGMASLDEVEAAVRTVKQYNDQIALLHCVSEYPANPADVNLRAMQTMADNFDTVVGFSDHTLGIVAPLVAVALGASIIEKHFTLDRSLPGPDHRASLEPPELLKMVEGIRIAEAVLGDGRKQPTAAELRTAGVVRKSLVAARDIPAGTILTVDLIAMQRPGNGLPPAMRENLIGRTVRISLKQGTPFTLENLA